MNPNAKKENAKTLASALGIEEANAMELLDAAVAITFDSTKKEDARFASFAQEMIQRTVTQTCGLDKNLDQVTVELVVGHAKPRFDTKHVFACFDSEEIRIDVLKSEHKPEGSRPIGLLLGACYAVGAMLKFAFKELLPFPPALPLKINLASLFGDDLAIFDSMVDFGEVVLAGAGAVGNGFVYALLQCDVKGTLHVVDDDKVSDGNLQRCLLFVESQIGSYKADCICEAVKSKLGQMETEPHRSRLQDVEFKTPGAWLKRLVVTVDSPRARRSLQNEIPGEVFDASTTGIQEVVFHFSKQPAELACLSCAYHESPEEEAHERHAAEALGVSLADVKTERITDQAADTIRERYSDIPKVELVGLAYDTLFKRLCGAQKLQTPEGRQVLAPFAFVSVLAGTLLAMEFLRRVARPQMGLFNDWCVSPWGNPVLRRRRILEKRSDCEFCGNELISRVAKKIWTQA